MHMVNRISNAVPRDQFIKPVKKVDNEAYVEPNETIGLIVSQTEDNTSPKGSLEQVDLPAEKAKKMTVSLNNLLETTNTKLRYEFHEKLERYYVTLVDSETDQVVREIPNKKLMDMYAAMLEFTGIFVDKKI